MIKVILFIVSIFIFIFISLKEDLSKSIEMDDKIKYPLIAIMLFNTFIQFFYKSLSQSSSIMFYISLFLPLILIFLEFHYNNIKEQNKNNE